LRKVVLVNMGKQNQWETTGVNREPGAHEEKKSKSMESTETLTVIWNHKSPNLKRGRKAPASIEKVSQAANLE